MELFMELVNTYQGFEFIQAYRDNEDHYLGGKGNTYWYLIIKNGKTKESFIGKYEDGEWKDIHIKGGGRSKKAEDMPSGSTIARISKYAYLEQDQKWVQRRKPSVTEDAHPHYHYVFGFGDKAVDVSEKYGVTIAYSNLKDVPAGFHLRYLNTGADVQLPDGAGF